MSRRNRFPAGIVERELSLAPGAGCVFCGGSGLADAVIFLPSGRISAYGGGPECQGKRISRLLFEKLVETPESRGSWTMMRDATEAGEQVYRKFGSVEWARTFDLGVKVRRESTRADRAAFGTGFADRSAGFWGSVRAGVSFHSTDV